jgi:hypothetical protein
MSTDHGLVDPPSGQNDDPDADMVIDRGRVEPPSGQGDDPGDAGDDERKGGLGAYLRAIWDGWVRYS